MNEPRNRSRSGVGALAGTKKPPKAESAPRGAKSILEALDDPDLFGGMFDAPSWEPWKAFLAAL